MAKGFFWAKSQVKKESGPLGYKDKNSFYASKPWRNLRAFRLLNNPFCQVCEAKGVLYIPANQVDHIKEIEFNPELALEYLNTQSICDNCHSEKNIKYLQKAATGKILNKITNIKDQENRIKKGS